MAKPPRHEHDHKHEHDPEHQHDRDREHEHEREREGEGDDPARHGRIIARRWLGSPPPSAERYARAIEQWNKLPGAVPTTPPVPKPSKKDSDQ